jgi:hypothetical protein
VISVELAAPAGEGVGLANRFRAGPGASAEDLGDTAFGDTGAVCAPAPVLTAIIANTANNARNISLPPPLSRQIRSRTDHRH